VTFALTAKQIEAQSLLASGARHIMLYGGSRSGKTFLLVRSVVLRALKAPKSRHAIFRYRFTSVKATIVLDTFPKVMDLCFPGVQWNMNKTDFYATVGDGAEIWFAGLDDKERAEKILGAEFVTLYFNECSQIPYASVGMALTRLAQLVNQRVEGKAASPLPLRAYYDENPPSKAHWTYQQFELKRDPETKAPLLNPSQYVSLQINPDSNIQNISSDYLETLGAMSARQRLRFLKGQFGDATPGQLISEESIEKWRMIDGGSLPQLVRVVVAVDPSGSGDTDNADNDAIGIVVVGLGTDGRAYLLEDCTVKAGPATWAKVATDAYDRHSADVIVAEMNYGGAMVQQTILTARPRTPFKKVTATRGKHVRAEPFAALYEQGKIRHVGIFPDLEDELCAFSINGYLGPNSPNRADAMIWALAELFPALVAGKRDIVRKPREYAMGSWAS
jgi:hypothetical protein